MINHCFFRYLNSNNLDGTIPSEIGLLLLLTQLDLDTNDLSGSIPSEIGELSSLARIDLYTNDLDGAIPTQIGESFSQLTHLGLFDNNLNGNIPSQIGLIANLQTLVLSNNNLTGEIPFQLQNLASLSQCNVWFGNHLTCDPSYPTGVTRCMGTTGVYDYSGLTDSPRCPPVTSSSSLSTTSPSSTVAVSLLTPHIENVTAIDDQSFSISFASFPIPIKFIRIQYRIKHAPRSHIKHHHSLIARKPQTVAPSPPPLKNWVSKTVSGAATSTVVKGLVPGSTYEVRIFAKSTSKIIGPVSPIIIITIPHIP